MSWGYINSDGSSSYFTGDENADDTNATTVGNGIAALLGFAIGFGVPAYMAYKMQNMKKNAKKQKDVLKENAFGRKNGKLNRKKEDTK